MSFGDVCQIDKLTDRCPREREKRERMLVDFFLFFSHIYLLVQDGRRGQNSSMIAVMLNHSSFILSINEYNKMKESFFI